MAGGLWEAMSIYYQSLPYTTVNAFPNGVKRLILPPPTRVQIALETEKAYG